MANLVLRTPFIEGPYSHELFNYDIHDPKKLPFTPEPVMLDVETHKTGFRDIRTVQLFQASWSKAEIFDTNTYPIEYIYEAIKDRHVVIHNATFEMSCFQNDLKPEHISWKDYKPENPFKNFSDTFLLARQVLYKNEGFGLDAISKTIHGVDYYRMYAESIGYTQTEIDKYKKHMQKSFLDTPKSNKRSLPLRLEQLVYAAYDVMVMPKIYKELKHFESEFIIQLDYKFIDWVTKYQWEGLPIDTRHLQNHQKEQHRLIQEATDYLPAGLNPRSYKQVRALLNSEASDDVFLASVVAGSDTDKYDDDPSYKEYRQNCARMLRQIRSAYKRVEYLNAYESQLHKYGRVKGFVSPRTISGRIAAEELNVLQIPRTLKNVFGFEDKNKFIVYADYSQLELRMLAAVIREEVMVQKFTDNEDLHVYSATQVYEEPVESITKFKRFIGKFFNFSGVYGAGAAKMCSMLMKEAGIFMTEEEMRPMLRKWKRGFPALGAWHAVNGRNKAKTDCTLSGRNYKANMYTDLNAIKIQGSASEVFKLAHLYIRKSYPDILMGDSIYDSFIGKSEGMEHAIKTAKVIGLCMVTAWFEILQNSKVPYLKMPTNVLIHNNWGTIDNEEKHIKKLEFEGTYEQYEKVRGIVIEGKILEYLNDEDIFPSSCIKDA